MRKLLLPLSYIYLAFTGLRNFFYDRGWLRSFEFDFPVILIGNLSTGGTGKTPHIEYLIRLLKEKYKVATLSRGYKRNTNGFILSANAPLVEDIGDEPKLLKYKYPNIEVAVCENRVTGVYSILQYENDVQVILLDDGFQHRRITAGLKIILTAYDNLFCDDVVLPAGNLRESQKGKYRAEIIIVSKCPAGMQKREASEIRTRLNLIPFQQLFFTSLQYKNIFPLFDEQNEKEIHAQKCLLVSGIANNKHIVEHVKQNFLHVETLTFPDHHYFIDIDLEKIKNTAQQNTVLITTEKDAVRLIEAKEKILELGLSFFVLPVEVVFLFEASKLFDENILQYIRKSIPAKADTLPD